MSDFSGRPFVAGSLIGRRAFAVEDDGTLVGPSYPAPFVPGENNAACYAKLGYRIQIRNFERSMARIVGGSIPDLLPMPPLDPADHQPGTLRCVCGFYAFFDGSSTYELPHRVTALIEGYGVCSVGERGFRAEKARLVALVGDLPTERSGGRPLHRALDRTADWITDHAIGGLCACVSIVVAVYAAVGGVAAAAAGMFLVAAPLLILAALCGFVGYADFHGIPRKYPSVSPEVKRCVIPPLRGRRDGAVPFTKVAARYPDVPVYPSVEAAIAAHPLTVPDAALNDDAALETWLRNGWTP